MWPVLNRLLGPEGSPNWADIEAALLMSLGPMFLASPAGEECQKAGQAVTTTLEEAERSRAGHSRAGRTRAQCTSAGCSNVVCTNVGHSRVARASLAAAERNVLQQRRQKQLLVMAQLTNQVTATAETAAAHAEEAARLADAAMAHLLVRTCNTIVMHSQIWAIPR